MNSSDGQEKRLVESFKATNRQLRKQLQNLNNEIDKVIAFKTNRIGLKKAPAVDKTLLKSQDLKLLQQQVDNMRKRLDNLNRDNDNMKERSKINYMQSIKLLQVQLSEIKIEKQALRKQVMLTDKKIKELNTTDVLNQEFKLYEKIEQVNQELIRTKKIQSQLARDIQEQKKIQSKLTDVIHQTVQKHKEKVTTLGVVSRIQLPVTHSARISEDEWKNLKKQFLELKDSKQHEENQLNEANDRLRTEIRALEHRLKQKKSTIQKIHTLEVRRKQRNYSTLDESGSGVAKVDKSFRYRSRNNSYNYNKQ